jgi:hypothetical protein
MNNEQCSNYKGCEIITRSSEVSVPSWWAEPTTLPASRTRCFTASFSVTPWGHATDAWQRFPATRFDTRVLAVANALALARSSIDAKPCN